MRIRSKWKDYYDSAMSFGVDETLQYLRFPKIYDFKEIKAGLTGEGWMISRPVPDTRDTGIYKPYHGEFVVGFCGKLYQGVHVVIPPKPFEKEKHQFLYGERARKYIEDRQPKVSYRSWGRHRREIFNTEPVRTNDEIFLEVDAPLFLVNMLDFDEVDSRYNVVKLTTNTRLLDLDFGKCVDPFTAFQEISMYLSNQLVKEKKVDDVEDKYRIAQHGFDKFSFRHPTRLSKLK